MKKAGGTLKELTIIWRQLDGRGKSNVMAVAKGELEYLKRYPEARQDAIRKEEMTECWKETSNTVEQKG